MSGNKSEARKARVPLGVPRQRLAVTGRPGYVRRWVNDTGGRILMAQEGGYSLVPRDGAEFIEQDVNNRNDSLSNAISKVVDKTTGMKAYLMEIPAGLYQTDQLDKQNRILDTENALREGSDAHGKPGTQGRYIPKEGIKIS